MRISIIGAGAFGTALSKILLKNGHELAFYDPKVNPGYSLSSACDFAEAFVFSAPSCTLRDTLKHFDKDSKNKLFICASKGFLSLDDFSSLSKLQLLSGASFAEDLVESRPATLTTTSVSVARLFESDFLTFEICHDKLGILLCGSLKNIYAIYAGLAGLRPATREYQDYLIQSLEEFRTILRLNHCNPATAELSCGFRDLAVTSSDPRSRNYSFGVFIGGQNSHKRPLKSDSTIEGLSALRTLKNSKKHPLVLPTDPDDFETSLPILHTVIKYTKEYL